MRPLHVRAFAFNSRLRYVLVYNHHTLRLTSYVMQACRIHLQMLTIYGNLLWVPDTILHFNLPQLALQMLALVVHIEMFQFMLHRFLDTPFWTPFWGPCMGESEIFRFFPELMAD